MYVCFAEDKVFGYLATQSTLNKRHRAYYLEACQKLLPIWDELGKMFKNRSNVMIAKIDYTANNAQLLNLERYPFFRYFPVGSVTRVDPYKGEHSLDAFAKFLEEQIKAGKKVSSKAKKKGSMKKDGDMKKKEEL